MTFDSLAAFNATLQRKALVGAVLVGPSSAAALTAITAGTTPANSTLAPMTGYVSIGKITTDGVAMSDQITKQEDRGWGDSYPSRIDVESETAALNFSPMETNKQSIQAFYGVDQTAVQAQKLTGEVTFDKPRVPVLNYRRILALFQDQNKDGTGPIWWGIHLPKALLSANGDQTFQFASPGLTYPLTAEAVIDDVVGTAMRLFWGGPGLASLIAGMGYTISAT